MAITNDKLTWIYTSYGLNRLAQALNNSSIKLQLYKIKVGDANGSYYKPDKDATSLINQTASFYINEKGLDSVNTTVWFKTTFTENSCGYEIREVGLYETINNVDYLFAISTCQPMNKPNVSDNYVISVDYVLNLKSTNLSSVYNQIALDADNEYVKQTSFEDLQNTVLYVEGNLMEQISKNSHIIGLNRATQLYEKITENHVLYSNSATASNFTNLLNFTDLNNIAAYWVFNYSKYLRSTSSVVDLSVKNNYLDLNQNLSMFTRDYKSLAPYLDISDTSYFKLDSTVSPDLLNNSKTDDSPISIFFLLKNNKLDTKNTLLAKSDYKSNKNIFEINKSSNNSIEFKLFTDTANYITYDTVPNIIPSDFYVLSIRYNGNKNNPLIDIFINLKKVAGNLGSNGTYTGMENTPSMLTSYTTDGNGNPQNCIDSCVSIISIVKDTLADTELKSIILNIMSLAGKDTCLIV